MHSVSKENKKSILVWETEKIFIFSIFVTKLFWKKELWFSFFVRIIETISSSLLFCFWKRPCLKRKKSRFGVEKLKKVFTFGKVLKPRTTIDFFFRGKEGLCHKHKRNEEKKDSKILRKSEKIVSEGTTTWIIATANK